MLQNKNKFMININFNYDENHIDNKKDITINNNIMKYN